MNLFCVLLTYLIESWISLGCSYKFNVVHVQREKSQYVILQHHMNYTLSRTKIKEIYLLRDILVYHFVFYICLIVCKFAIIETRAYDIAHDESAMSSLIIQSIYYGQVQPLVFLKVLQYSQENNCVGVSF